MERREGYKVEIGKTTYIYDSKVKVSYIEDPFSLTDETDEHEAEHVIGGVEDGAHLVKASSRPGPGYEGITIFDRYTGPGAAAPYANKRGGTSHDVRVIQSNGDSVTAEGIKGLNNIRRRPRHVKRIAQELHKGDIDGQDVDRIYRELAEGEGVIINIKTPDGNIETFETRTNNLTVDIPREMIPNTEISLAA